MEAHIRTLEHSTNAGRSAAVWESVMSLVIAVALSEVTTLARNGYVQNTRAVYL